jgi:hypothetical protein
MLAARPLDAEQTLEKPISPTNHLKHHHCQPTGQQANTDQESEGGWMGKGTDGEEKGL